MARIKNTNKYPIKSPVETDYVVGTDSEGYGRTVNFLLSDLKSDSALQNNLVLLIKLKEVSTIQEAVSQFNELDPNVQVRPDQIPYIEVDIEDIKHLFALKTGKGIYGLDETQISIEDIRLVDADFQTGNINESGSITPVVISNRQVLAFSDHLVFESLSGNIGTSILKVSQTLIDSLEPSLGNPSEDNQVLVSQSDGTRSWMTISGGTNNFEGYFESGTQSGVNTVVNIGDNSGGGLGAFINIDSENQRVEISNSTDAGSIITFTKDEIQIGTTKLNIQGDVEATSFAVIGGTGNNLLLDDGSLTPISNFSQDGYVSNVQLTGTNLVFSRSGSNAFSGVVSLASIVGIQGLDIYDDTTTVSSVTSINFRSSDFQVSDNGAGDVEISFIGSGGSGDVTKVGTPVSGQIPIWTGDGTVKGSTSFTIEEFSGLANRLNVGEDDTIAGVIRLFGAPNNSGQASLSIYTNVGDDSEVDFWQMKAWDGGKTGNFRLGGEGIASDSLVIDEITGILSSPVSTNANINSTGNKALITKEYADENYLDTTLPLTSTITTDTDCLEAHVGGMNEVNSASDVEITVQPFSTESIPIGSVVVYTQRGTGSVSISYNGSASGDIAQTYRVGDTITLWHKSEDVWVILNKPHRLDSNIEDEPTGFTPIFNIGTISQANFDAGTPVSGTTYLITS